ncbi:MAG TPA: nicotinamide riboside transporter PnuC [Rikenellaceae bacterium]|nr:nicotinamide riboside transporter PnuC [Rikenellaceae bacterium]
MNWIEIIAAVTGLLYVVLEIRQKRLMWVVGAVSSLFFMAVFFSSSLYAAMGLQVYYLFISIYGWKKWGGNNSDPALAKEVVVAMKFIPAIISIAISILSYFIINWILEKYTNDPHSELDAFVTVGSMLATYWVTKKHIEHWILWIIADAVAVYLYVQQGLYATTILYVIYIIAAVAGYIHWRKFPRV